MKTLPLFRSLSAVVVLIATMASVSSVHAQQIEESHLKAAKATLEELNASARFDQILPSLAARLKARMIPTRPDEEEQITKIVDDAALELAPRRGDLEDEFAKIYARNFTEQELNEITAFFASETGKKFQKVSPLVLREMDKASRIWATGIGRDLAGIVGKKMAELNAAQPDVTPADQSATGEGETQEGEKPKQ